MKFHEVQIGQQFQIKGSSILTKISKIGAYRNQMLPSSYVRINSQTTVIWVDESPTAPANVSREDKELIDLIVSRASRDYAGRIDPYRLTNGLIAAHLTKPIRLNDLLRTCEMDFYIDIVLGVYRHYDPKTGTIKDGWTAQHSEPKEPNIWELLFGRE